MTSSWVSHGCDDRGRWRVFHEGGRRLAYPGGPGAEACLKGLVLPGGRIRKKCAKDHRGKLPWPQQLPDGGGVLAGRPRLGERSVQMRAASKPSTPPGSPARRRCARNNRPLPNGPGEEAVPSRWSRRLCNQEKSSRETARSTKFLI